MACFNGLQAVQGRCESAVVITTMGSRASLPKIVEQQQQVIPDNSSSSKHNMSEMERLVSRLSELEARLDTCKCAELKVENEDLSDRLVKLEEEVADLKRSGRATRRGEQSDSRLSVARDFGMDNISFRSDFSAGGGENSPAKRSNCDSEVSPASNRRKHRSSSKKNKNYSIHPMNDIEAYGKGLDLHELNHKELSKSSPSESRKQRTSSIACPSGVGLKTLPLDPVHKASSFEEPSGIGNPRELEEIRVKKTSLHLHTRGYLTRSASVDVAGNSASSTDAATPLPPLSGAGGLTGRPASGQRRQQQQRVRKTTFSKDTAGSGVSRTPDANVNHVIPTATDDTSRELRGGDTGAAMDVDHLVETLLAQTEGIGEEGGQGDIVENGVTVSR